LNGVERTDCFSEPADGFRTSRDALGRAKPVLPRRDSKAAAAVAVMAFALLPGSAQADAPAALRETGLYGDGLQVRPDNLPFAPQYPLWSDGADKRRWIHLPPGTAIDASGPQWIFPVGTRLWKEFRVAGRRIETRLIEREAGGWRFSTYAWNAAGTDATLVPPEGAEVASPRGGVYKIPGEVDCRACHEGRATPVLGFSLLQLSPDRDPGAPHAGARDGAAGENLRTLAARGLLRELPARVLAQPPRVAAATPTARAALGYLHANCGHCHNQGGPLAGLEMTLDPNEGVAALIGSTVGRPSRFLPPGASGDAVRIAAGRPDLSVVVARMRARDPLVRMPPLGTTVVDDEGLALIERWIRETTNSNDTHNANKERDQ
jgi:hypothetical protein